MRIYDPRLGKFLSVDPLYQNFPWNSSYSFAENDILRNIDLDGGEKLSYLEKLEYNGGWMDHLKAIPNAMTSILDAAIIDVFNSGVDTYHSLKRGTYGQDLKNELKTTYSNTKESLSKAYEYHTNTSFVQQMEDLGRGLKDPRTLEKSLAILGGARIPLIGTGQKGNLLNIPKTKPTVSLAATEGTGINVTKGTNQSLTPYWPSNGGALGEWSIVMAKKGEVLDRYGSIYGSYASPVGTPFNMRSLSSSISTADYFKFEVLKPFPMKTSIIAPAFGEVGLGIQYQTPISINFLKDFGYIKILD
jgi:hypothetical protein